MFCPHCGAENSDSATFCSKCGKTFGTESIQMNANNTVKAESSKSKIIALIISFIFTGLGIAYAGDVKKGVGIFAVAIVLNLLGMYVSAIFSLISIVLWIYGMYVTYKMF